jgi:hypothetical protein
VAAARSDAHLSHFPPEAPTHREAMDGHPGSLCPAYVGANNRLALHATLG